MTGFPGWSFTQPVARSKSPSMAIPTPPTCFPAEISSGRTTSSFEKSERFLPSSWIVTLKMRFVTASGRPVAVTGPAVDRSGSWRFHADRKHRYDQLLQRWPAVVKGEISARFEDPTAERKHKIKIGVVAERRGSHPDATSRGRSAAPDPTAAMKVNLVTSRRVDPHRLIAIRREEQMPVVGRQHAMFDARCGKLADGPRQIVDDRIHHLPGLEREPVSPAWSISCERTMTTWAPSIFLASLDGCRLNSSSRATSAKLGHARGGKFLPSGKVGKECVVDPHTERACLLDNAEARRCPRLQRGHANRRDAGQRARWQAGH